METLKLKQVIEIQGFEYKVGKDPEGYFMLETGNLENEKVFDKLGIDKVEFCSKFYETNDWGLWPYAPDLESLTACVQALIEYKQGTDQPKSLSSSPIADNFGYVRREDCNYWPSDAARDAFYDAVAAWNETQNKPSDEQSGIESTKDTQTNEE